MVHDMCYIHVRCSEKKGRTKQKQAVELLPGIDEVVKS